jgi:predicted RNA binding protein YcfA (HicA-like mRNA interferase family)
MGRMATTIQALRMIRALVRLGWTLDRVAGSHHVLTRPGHTPVTIPVKKGATLKEGTARSILKRAGVDEDAFFEAY